MSVSAAMTPPTYVYCMYILYVWKYHITLYHFASHAPLTRTLDSDLQLRKQLALAFSVLRSWTCGLALSAAQSATIAWLLLEAELSVCFYCIVGNRRWGVPWST